MDVTVAGRRVHSVQLNPPGSAAPHHPTLVFLHEALGNIALWRDFPAALVEATGCPGVVIERLGFGESDEASGPRSARYLHDDAEDLLPAVLAALDIADTILVGHSDGGTIALLYAAAQPAHVRGVITEAAHVFVEPVTLAGIDAAVAAYETGDLAPRLARYHGARTDALFHAWADTWRAPWFADWDITDRLPDIRCPVLALQGADDAYGSPDQLAAIARGVRGPVTTHLIPDCGHSPHFEARARVLAEMAAFVASLI